MTELKERTGLGEHLYTMTLPNGLRCNFVPKPGYHKTYAMFTTQFGAIDDSFRTDKDADYTVVPAGTAHFLEHKLFDKADYDAFDLFGKSGASANAFTSATQTSYLFSGTDAIADNLNILLDFVQDPYFTDQTVEKEKGIIGQEIQMYQDDAAGASTPESWVTSTQRTPCTSMWRDQWNQLRPSPRSVAGSARCVLSPQQHGADDGGEL